MSDAVDIVIVGGTVVDGTGAPGRPGTVVIDGERLRLTPARAEPPTAARTIDAIWHAAGDRSADFSWYTKRAILTPIYAATLLYWLRDDSFDDEATLAFLDRRLAAIGRIGKLRRRVEGLVDRFRPGALDPAA